MGKWQIGGLWLASIAATVVVMILISGNLLRQQDAEWKKKACASEMAWLAVTNKSPGSVGQAIQSRPYSREVCENFALDGVAVIPTY